MQECCTSIKKLFEYGGTYETYGIIDELKAKYARRPAIIEKLKGLALRLAKDRKSFTSPQT